MLWVRFLPYAPLCIFTPNNKEGVGRMKTNVKTNVYTHEGAKTTRVKALTELKRAVLSCLLWEDSFYESGESIADRIITLSKKVNGADVEALAIIARYDYNLRHAPLWLIVGLLEKSPEARANAKYLIPKVINRPDEMGELISLYWKHAGEKVPLAKSLKVGLAESFHEFNEYSFAKHDRKNADIRLRDVMFLTHPKPTSKEEEILFRKIANQELAVPDTWETALSAGADKKATFERLMYEDKLGALAFLRNLRNMKEAGVSKKVVKEYFERVDFSKVFPYRFIAAAKAVPSWEDIIEDQFLKSAERLGKLDGSTILLVDVSGSMFTPIGDKSDMLRIDAANGLSMLLREMCEDIRIFSFSNTLVEVPLRRGFGLIDAIRTSQYHGNTYLGRAIRQLTETLPARRLIVITDEQSHDTINKSGYEIPYIINVASYQNGVGYGDYIHINGFSEGIIRYIVEFEKLINAVE